MLATTAGLRAFKLALSNPGDAVVGDLYAIRTQQYSLGWNIYTNQAFSSLSGFQSHAKTEGLYEKTKPIYNPATVIVDVYASHVYQGVLSEDGAGLPDGEQLAIPLSRDTSPELRAAIAQLWQWGNWQQNMGLWVIFGGSMGDSFVEGVEDVDRGRVWPQVIPPSHIKEIDRDPRGNVTYYEKEYSYYDREQKRTFKYTKRVSKDRIETFRDGDPFAFGNDAGAAYDNPFGFVPLVYNAHRDMGTMPGAPAVRNWNKIEILNSLATRVDAFIRVQSQSPQLISGDGEVTAATVDAKKASENDLKLLKIQGSATVHQLSGNLDIAAAEKRIESLITEIEHDHPEATMYSQLRSMGEVTGPAAERLMGDVRGYVHRARAGYDDASKRIFQMLVSMAAMRANDRLGGWQNLTTQQKKFSVFDLSSYERGDLDFAIDQRPLIPMTSLERWQLMQAKYAAMAAGVTAEQPIVYQMRQEGATEEEVAEYRKEVQASQFGDGFVEAVA